MDEWNLSLQRKQPTMLVTIEFSSENKNFGKYGFVTVSLTASHSSKDFARRVGINECDLKILCYEIINIWKISDNSLNQYLASEC